MRREGVPVGKESRNAEERISPLFLLFFHSVYLILKQLIRRGRKSIPTSCHGGNPRFPALFAPKTRHTRNLAPLFAPFPILGVRRTKVFAKVASSAGISAEGFPSESKSCVPYLSTGFDGILPIFLQLDVVPTFVDLQSLLPETN